MVKMLTLFGVDLKELNYNDLQRELAVQKFILLAIKSFMRIELNTRSKRKTVTQLSTDKEAMTDIYTEHLEAFITEIEYVLSHRLEPVSNAHTKKSPTRIRRQNNEKIKGIVNEGGRIYRLKKSMDKDGLLVSWDKERFMLIAQDRGYQTEETVIQHIGRELNLDLPKTKLLMTKGRFTWGQVLCLGAMLEMTPKEFCDTFLAGYFVDHYGEYRADYENLCKEELLKSAVKPQYELPPMEEVEVGADGAPLDEEIWFDE